MIKTKPKQSYRTLKPARRGSLVAILVLTLFSIATEFARAQVFGNQFIYFTSEVTAAPNASITLKWLPVPASSGWFRVSRKARGDDISNFSIIFATANMPGSVTEWTDTDVDAGDSFDYRVERAPGFIGHNPAGIELPLVESRGTALIIVEAQHAEPLRNLLNRFESDLGGDGWTVIREGFDTAVSYIPAATYKDQVRQLKSRIEAHNPTTVILIGRLPIARSGMYARDGHFSTTDPSQPNHEGAWAADTFYVTPSEPWSDNLENVNSPFPENQNRPNDGKWDQEAATDVIREIGRIDLHNMFGFSSQTTEPGSARELLAKYFDKNHRFRHGLRSYSRQGLIDMVFNPTSEQSQVSTRSSFAAMFGTGAEDVVAASYFPSLVADDYLWACAAHCGSFTEMHSCGTDGRGVGSSTTEYYNSPYQPYQGTFATDEIRVPFTMLSGSYFGDWENPSGLPNNFLRAPLCNSETLVSIWMGEIINQNAEAYIAEMALGETVGYAVRKSHLVRRWVPSNPINSIHVSIMGDPTLRLHVVKPPSNVTAQSSGGGVQLTWTPTPPPETVAGYHVYRGASHRGPFQRVSGNSLITGSSFTDATPSSTEKIYMVRAIKREVTPSGTYTNASQGAYPALKLSAVSVTPTTFQYSISGGVGQEVRVESATSVNATTWTTIATVTLTIGSTTLTHNTTDPQRFYRLASDQVPFWSDNTIGFVRRTAPVGWSMIANQFNRGNNAIEVILPSPPEGTRLQKYNDSPGGYWIVEFADGEWGGNLPLTFGPGDGGNIFNPTAAPMTVTFMGDVPQGTLSTAIPAGWSIKSSKVPQAGRLDTDLGYPVSEGDKIQQQNPSTGGFIINEYVDGEWGGSTPGGPIISVGESFWIQTSSPKTWTRKFNVTP